MNRMSLKEMAATIDYKPQEILDMAKACNADATMPGDKDIYIDVDKIKKHLEKLIEEELKILNGIKED